MIKTVNAFDDWVLRSKSYSHLTGFKRFIAEFFIFGMIQARACLFAGLFFVSVFIVPIEGWLGVHRYDLLLIIAIGIQALMLYLKLETWDEAKAITLFHIVGFALEAFKTSPMIGSWSYPGEAYTKVLGVPLFSGFMYAAVGSYIIQAWRLFHLRILHHPVYWMATSTAILVYVNFFTHHFIGDYRWYIACFALGLYARSVVVYTPLDRERKMPLLLGFVLIGFFIWLAENISTFFSVWHYPDQLGAWSVVHLSKWSSWSMLVIMTFTIVTQLKHIKEKVHVPH